MFGHTVARQSRSRTEFPLTGSANLAEMATSVRSVLGRVLCAAHLIEVPSGENREVGESPTQARCGDLALTRKSEDRPRSSSSLQREPVEDRDVY